MIFKYYLFYYKNVIYYCKIISKGNNISNGNTETITLEYVPGENDTLSDDTTANYVLPDKDWTYEDYQKYCGYYKMTKNDKEEKN